MGSAILGADVLGSDLLLAATEIFGSSTDATIILADRRTTAFGAALANAAFISQTELTVGVGRAIVHPGTQAVPVALAEGERLGSSGADVLLSLVVAYEVLIRLGWSLTHVPGEPLSKVRPQLTLRGWYAPSLLGSFGAAAAAASLRGLDAAQVANAFGICGNLSPTTVHAGAREGMVKGLGEGWAAALGLFAVDLAERGFTGVPRVTEHLFPLLVDGPDKVDFERFDDGLGERLEFLDFGGNQTMFNGSRTSSITDCALELRNAHPIDPERIAEIRIDTMSRFKGLDDPAPTNELGGKFSIPYCVAQVFIGRSREEMLDVAFSEAAFDDPRWRPIAQAVRIEVDPEFDSDFESYPRKSSSSRITVTMTDGSQVSHRVTGAFGMLGGTRATPDDFARKFLQLAGDRLPGGYADEVVKVIDGFETQPDVHTLMRLCARRRPDDGG
jgi:2-methylcitrate dehydratase PrpD